MQTGTPGLAHVGAKAQTMPTVDGPDLSAPDV